MKVIRGDVVAVTNELILQSNSIVAGPQHVEKYHEWMQDPKLLEATGSEPLSMEEEIQMQQSWREDAEKVTFIVLAKDACDWREDESTDGDFVVRNLNTMVGDVNLFLSDEEDDECVDHQAEPPQQSKNDGDDEKRQKQAELDIMIAEEAYQKQGLGREASCLMMLYGAKNLGIRRFFCKINEDNQASRALFQKLGFEQCDYAECFKQVELELKKESVDEMAATIEKLYGGSMTTFSCPINDEEDER